MINIERAGIREFEQVICFHTQVECCYSVENTCRLPCRDPSTGQHHSLYRYPPQQSLSLG